MITNDNGVDREMTAEEIKQYELVTAQIEADKQSSLESENLLLQVRKAPLRRLGLTDEEINTVLGL